MKFLAHIALQVFEVLFFHVIAVSVIYCEFSVSPSSPKSSFHNRHFPFVFVKPLVSLSFQEATISFFFHQPLVSLSFREATHSFFSIRPFPFPSLFVRLLVSHSFRESIYVLRSLPDKIENLHPRRQVSRRPVVCLSFREATEQSLWLQEKPRTHLV